MSLLLRGKTGSKRGGSTQKPQKVLRLYEAAWQNPCASCKLKCR